MGKINFLMGLHCHQPVDNFTRIFEEAYKKSYEPFIDTLERHPKIKLSIHYSGSLLDWISEKRPHFIEKVRRLVERGQLEILTGGYFEPVLSMVPAADARGQIEMFTQSIKHHFNVKPSGIWVAERVWDPRLPEIFKDLGISYTILDDFHFKQAGVKEDDIFGYYTLSDFDKFSVFASIKKLRYSIPFRDVDVTMDFLKKISDKNKTSLVTFADDCEKFGFWPHTYDWVYKKGWLEKFFKAIEKADWINTMTFEEALKKEKPLGKINIPHSSYSEMMQWCGGDFNNFFRRYEESNLMRRRMLHISQKLKEAVKRNPEENNRLKEAKMELYKSQSNCAYWHGVFGGVYISYLRQAVYSHLIKAEDAIRPVSEEPQAEILTFDEEKKRIICVRNKTLSLYIDPEYAGSVFEIDYKPLSLNLVNTMSRRYELYHEKIKKTPRIDLNNVEKKVDENEEIDLYDVLGVKEPNLRKYLHYDSYRKLSLMCHLLDVRTSFSDFVKSSHEKKPNNPLLSSYKHTIKSDEDRLIVSLRKEGRVFVNGEAFDFKLKKCIFLQREAEILARFDLENTSRKAVKFLFGIEFNWSVEDKNFMRPKRKIKTKNVIIKDRYRNLKIKHSFNTPMGLWSFPVYTLSESEMGICKSFQELSLLFQRKVALRSGQKFSLETRIGISE